MSSNACNWALYAEARSFGGSLVALILFGFLLGCGSVPQQGREASDQGEPVSARPFVTTWMVEAAGDSIIIPTSEIARYDFRVDWGDGTTERITGIDPDPTHVYEAPGTYTVAIQGTFPHLFLNAPPIHSEDWVRANAARLRSIEQWGTVRWESMAAAFEGAVNVVHNATDRPDLRRVRSMESMFEGARAFNGVIGDWNVSVVSNMSGLFENTPTFNQPIGDWDVSSVTDMTHMFFFATAFDQDLSGWDVSSVQSMSGMFGVARAFNHDIGGWDTGNVTSMRSMFLIAGAFDQDIGDWDVSRVTNMVDMFHGATVFNQDLSDWDTGQVGDMSGMFANTDRFNQDIGTWDVSAVTRMNRMFRKAKAFNQDVGRWDVSGVVSMESMFAEAGAFDQDLSGWQIASVRAFEKAPSYVWVDDCGNPFAKKQGPSGPPPWTGSVESDSGSSNPEQESGPEGREPSADTASATTAEPEKPREDTLKFSEESVQVHCSPRFERERDGKRHGFLVGAELSPRHYDALLNSWGRQPVQPDLVFHAGRSQYTTAARPARQRLIDEHGWQIWDGGLCECEDGREP